MIKVASKASEDTYAPDILAHELGHASLHGDSKLLMPARSIAPMAGSIANIVTGTPYGLAGHLVPLVDEGYANVKAMETLKDWDIDEEDRSAARKRMGLGFASYAIGPAVDAGMTVGALASGSTGMRIAAPIAGRLARRAASPFLVEEMDRTPIKGLSKSRAIELAKRTRPETDVYFSKKQLPDRGGFVSRPITEPTRKELANDPLRKELGAFIGRKASGKLLRKGGVLIGPSN